jgi:hypothetical protein
MNHDWNNYIRYHVALASQHKCIVIMGGLPV